MKSVISHPPTDTKSSGSARHAADVAGDSDAVLAWLESAIVELQMLDGLDTTSASQSRALGSRDDSRDSPPRWLNLAALIYTVSGVGLATAGHFAGTGSLTGPLLLAAGLVLSSMAVAVFLVAWIFDSCVCGTPSEVRSFPWSTFPRSDKEGS